MYEGTSYTMVRGGRARGNQLDHGPWRLSQKEPAIPWSVGAEPEGTSKTMVRGC